jgi:hypothetical protein
MQLCSQTDEMTLFEAASSWCIDQLFRRLPMAKPPVPDPDLNGHNV